MEHKLRYVRVEKVSSPGHKNERNKRILEFAQLIPESGQLASVAGYWFVTTEELNTIRYNDKLFDWKGQDRVKDANGVEHYLYRVNFKAKEGGIIEFEFKNGSVVQLQGVPAQDILLQNIGASKNSKEPFDLKDLLQKLPPKDIIVINTILLVPNEPDFVQLAETALSTVGFKKEASSPDRQYLYSHTDAINTKRHVLLVPFGHPNMYLKIDDYLPQASEALLLIDNKGEKQDSMLMAIKQVNSVPDNNILADNTWEFQVKTLNFGQLELNYELLEPSVKTLFATSRLHGILGGASCQNATNNELQAPFARFLLEWILNSDKIVRHIPESIYLCFRFEPDIVRAFSEYSAIILAALDIEYEYAPVVVNGSVLVYIRCPSYIPWYILQRQEDIFNTLSDYKLTEIYECFISDVETSIKRQGNEKFVDELKFLKELMLEDDVTEQPTSTRFKVTSSQQMPATLDKLSPTQLKTLESKYNALKTFDARFAKTLADCYNYDKIYQQLFTFKAEKNVKIAVRVFVSSAPAGLATNVAKLMRSYDGKSIVDGVHAGLQIANTIVEWNQSGLVHIGELKHTCATAVLLDVQDSVKFDFNEETAKKMINFIQKWSILYRYSATEFNSHRFVRDFLQETLNVSLVERFKGPLGAYMEHVMSTKDTTPRLISKSHGTMVFKTHKELEDVDRAIHDELSDDEIKLLKIFHRGFQLQEAAHGQDVSSCIYGLPTNGLEILNDSGKPMKL